MADNLDMEYSPTLTFGAEGAAAVQAEMEKKIEERDKNAVSRSR